MGPALGLALPLAEDEPLPESHSQPSPGSASWRIPRCGGVPSARIPRCRGVLAPPPASDAAADGSEVLGVLWLDDGGGGGLLGEEEVA